jgi:glycyl-tRNA synthetase beta chain
VQFAHLTAGNVTYGHRFLAPEAITITNAESYEQQLLAAKVMVDFAARKEKIREGVAAIAAQHALSVIDDEALLDEVTGLVEWPVPLLGMFEEKFLQLPPEVLISEMKTHQRYFALNDAGGKLTNRFITVANMVNADGGKKVIEGNSRVVRARLSDGEFYWNQDRKVSLEDWGKKLSDVVFHAKVGMMDAKVARIEKLAVAIFTNDDVWDDNPDALKLIRRAAQLCKADLTSGMVGEFPELQGIMGRYYAAAQGEEEDVADAIRDHYKPVGANDSIPYFPIAAILSIADKLDSIISLFAAGEKPTGSKDPLALRRAALGILRILIEHEWDVDLGKFCSSDVLDFFHDRLQNILREEGLRHDLIDVGLNTSSKSFIPTLLREKIKTLAEWLATPAGTTALAAIKRTMNILAAEEKKAKTTYAFDAAKCAALSHPVEQALLKIIGAGNITTPQELEAFTAPIELFFDREKGVLVTEEQFRDARLSLLAGVRDAANSIADFSKIEG